MDTAIKTRIDASKIVVQKTAEATRDFFGVKQLIKFLQLVNQKKKLKQKKFTFHQKKIQQIIDDLELL